MIKIKLNKLKFVEFNNILIIINYYTYLYILLLLIIINIYY